MEGPWTIETACLGLRPFAERDREELEGVLRDDEFVCAMREYFAENREARELARAWMASGGAPWAVVMKHSGELAGVLGTMREAGEGSAVLKTLYIVRVQSFDQGYAQEAARAAAAYARDALERMREKRDPQEAETDFSLVLRGSIVKHVHGVNILGFEFTAAKRSSA